MIILYFFIDSLPQITTNVHNLTELSSLFTNISEPCHLIKASVSEAVEFVLNLRNRERHKLSTAARKDPRGISTKSVEARTFEKPVFPNEQMESP
jgi:hypothetical protein